MAAAQVTLTGSGIKIEIIGKLATITKQDIKAAARQTQSKMRMKRAIPFSKVGGFIRYDRLELDKWLEGHSVVRVA